MLLPADHHVAILDSNTIEFTTGSPRGMIKVKVNNFIRSDARIVATVNRLSVYGQISEPVSLFQSEIDSYVTVARKVLDGTITLSSKTIFIERISRSESFPNGNDD